MSESPSEETAAELFDCYIQDLQSAGKKAELVQASGVTSLEDLAQKLGCDVAQLHKTVCLNYKDEQGRKLVAVVVPATGRVDMAKVANALGVNPKGMKSAQPDFITEQTGFVPGGIPPIGFDPSARLLDSRTLAHETIFAGGGNNLNSYTKMDPKLLIELYPDTIQGNFLQES